MTSILDTIKSMLGLNLDDTDFDVDVIVLINSAIMSLTQLGVGPITGFSISDNSKTWSDFIGASESLESVKAYIYMKVRIIFDSSISSALLENLKQQILELEVRLNLEAETPISEL